MLDGVDSLISVIIPTLNEEKRLPDCLAALGKQAYRDFEIIIADSGSKDRTCEIAEKAGAKIVQNVGGTIPSAKNSGARMAKGEILVFTDADASHAPDWLERIAEDFGRKEIVGVIGPLLPLEHGMDHRLMFWLTTNFIPHIASVFGFYMAHGANQAFKRETFLKVGGFDERLRYLEDNEMPNRIKKMGKVVFDSRLRVWTSARRFEKEGYLRNVIRYAKAYWEIYVLKRGTSEEYPIFHG